MTTEQSITMDVNGIPITATQWAKGDKHRLYFRSTKKGFDKGQACWDVQASVWIKCYLQYGPVFCDAIARAFDL